ncbi:hypothetical protein AAFN60_14650 [Roseibacillus persicicus]|uniref:hypothetical protein n=1 Tax=Roseibacillus persicicus TaxID=454148 RepID=UPI00398A5812
MKTLLLLILLQQFVSAAETPTKRTCRILFLNAPSSSPTTLFLFDGKESREVELPRMNFSPTYTLPGTEGLTLFFTPNQVSTLEEVPAGSPSVKVPSGTSDFYLLLSTDESNSVAPIRPQLVNAKFDQFKTGEILWFNLTSATVAGQVGEEKLALKPRSQGRTLAPDSAQKNLSINLAYRLQKDDPVYPICETTWPHDSRSRKVAFIFQEPNRRAPRVLAFNDYRPVQQKED